MIKREEVIKALREKNYAALSETSGSCRGLFRILISLSYDKKSVISWRAVEALGLAAGELAGRDPDAVRNLSQQLLWMMRDESGNNPWSVPEMLGEIVRNSGDLLVDLPPIIASFHEEEMLRPGVLRAIERIAGVRPDLALTLVPMIEESLEDADPAVRLYAVMLAGRLGLAEVLPVLGRLSEDDSAVTIYDGEELVETTVGKKAAEAVMLLRNQ